jgi:hypothetical protein
MFSDIENIEELNRRRTKLLSDPSTDDERIAEINSNFSKRRRQISLSQRGKNAVLIPYRVITHRVADPSIAVDAVFNPDAMLLTMIEPVRTPFYRDAVRISAHNQVEVILGETGKSTVVYSSFS